MNDLLNRAMAKEPGAVQEIIKLQRDGKSLRLYPDGRHGPLDEGRAPLLVGPSPEHLPRISLGQAKPIELELQTIGPITMHLILLTSQMVIEYDKCDDPVLAIRNHATKSFGYTAAWIPKCKRIRMAFKPANTVDFDLGLFEVRRMIEDWICLIDLNALDSAKCGFSDQDYEFAADFALDQFKPEY